MFALPGLFFCLALQSETNDLNSFFEKRIVSKLRISAKNKTGSALVKESIFSLEIFFF